MNRLKPIISFFKVPDLTVSGLKSHISHLALLVLFLACSEIHAQTVPLGDPMETYIRLLQPDLNQDSTSSFHLRPVSIINTQYSILKNNHPWSTHSFFSSTKTAEDIGPVTYSVYSPIARHAYNFHFPAGQNDGAMWQGRAQNFAFSAGGTAEYGPVTLDFRPEFGYSHNSEFDLAPSPPFFSYPHALSEYAEGLVRMDTPQRFGDEPFYWFHPGQSSLKVSQYGASAGISTANMWTGPAMHNPLTLSNNAPGFFHAFVETDGPYTTSAGNFEAKLFWGGLRESDYFDDDETNNLRYINGFIFNYSPSFFPGFHIGFSRTFYENYPDRGLSFKHLTRVFQPFTEGRFKREYQIQLSNEETERTVTADKAAHMISFFGRWVVPDYGFETWFEWGKNENSYDKRNLFTERVHTRSYVIGFLKRFEINTRHWITLNYEMTHLENLGDIKSNDYPVWYEHLIAKQGFTHRGQLLGAGIGPGSNSQLLRLDYLNQWGQAGLSFNRIAHHNDRLYRHYDHIRRNQEIRYGRLWEMYEAEFRYGIHALIFLPYNFEVQGDLYRSEFLNHHNIFQATAYNTNVQVTLRYNLPGFLR